MKKINTFLAQDALNTMRSSAPLISTGTRGITEILYYCFRKMKVGMIVQVVDHYDTEHDPTGFRQMFKVTSVERTTVGEVKQIKNELPVWNLGLEPYSGRGAPKEVILFSPVSGLGMANW